VYLVQMLVICDSQKTTMMISSFDGSNTRVFLNHIKGKMTNNRSFDLRTFEFQIVDLKKGQLVWNKLPLNGPLLNFLLVHLNKFTVNNMFIMDVI
jgi:hypothetical protein